MLVLRIVHVVWLLGQHSEFWVLKMAIGLPLGFTGSRTGFGIKTYLVEAGWNVMAHAQKPDFVFRRNGRVTLNRRGRQLSRLLTGEVCASAVVMLDTPCSEVVWRVLATHSIRQFPLHLLSRASPCAIMSQLDSIYWRSCFLRLRVRTLVYDSQ